MDDCSVDRKMGGLAALAVVLNEMQPIRIANQSIKRSLTAPDLRSLVLERPFGQLRTLNFFSSLKLT